jgi:hypothetical protein
MTDIKKRKKQWFKEGRRVAETSKNPEDIGRECERRKNALRKEIEPEITRLKLEGTVLVDEERILAATRSNGPTPTASSLGFFKGSMWIFFAIFFAIGTWACFSRTIAPFRLDNAHYAVLGFTAATIGIGHYLLWKITDLFPDRDVKISSLFVIVTAFVLLFVAELNLGMVRNSIADFSMQMQRSNYIQDLGNPSGAGIVSGARDFYGKSSRTFQIIITLMAIAFSLSSAVTFHEGFDRVTVDGKYLYDHGKLKFIRRKIIAISRDFKEFEVLPEISEAEFMRGALSVKEKHNPIESDGDTNRKLWLGILVYAFILFALLVFASFALGADSVITVVDFSGSSKEQDYKNIDEFQKNLKAVESLIIELQSGSEFMVVGITESSFRRPYILMNMRLGDDPGYFNEKLQAGKQHLINEWRNISKDLRPDAKASDIFGAIALAAYSLQVERNNSKVLILLSDMRHCNDKVDLERMTVIDEALINKVEKKILIPDLTGVKVYVIGAHTIGKDPRYYESLKQFWQQYFKRSGADLKLFTYERRIS